MRRSGRGVWTGLDGSHQFLVTGADQASGAERWAHPHPSSAKAGKAKAKDKGGPLAAAAAKSSPAETAADLRASIIAKPRKLGPLSSTDLRALVAAYAQWNIDPPVDLCTRYCEAPGAPADPAAVPLVLRTYHDFLVAHARAGLTAPPAALRATLEKSVSSWSRNDLLDEQTRLEKAKVTLEEFKADTSAVDEQLSDVRLALANASLRVGPKRPATAEFGGVVDSDSDGEAGAAAAAPAGRALLRTSGATGSAVTHRLNARAIPRGSGGKVPISAMESRAFLSGVDYKKFREGKFEFFNTALSHAAPNVARNPSSKKAVFATVNSDGMLTLAAESLSQSGSGREGDFKVLPAAGWWRVFYAWRQAVIDGGIAVADELDEYAALLRDLELEYMGSFPSLYQYYDVRVRHTLAHQASFMVEGTLEAVPLDWGFRDLQLITSLVLEHQLKPSSSKPGGGPSATGGVNNPGGQAPGAPVLRQADPNSKRSKVRHACTQFNSAAGCSRVGCTYDHVCRRCASDKHGKAKCPVPAGPAATPRQRPE